MWFSSQLPDFFYCKFFCKGQDFHRYGFIKLHACFWLVSHNHKPFCRNRNDLFPCMSRPSSFNSMEFGVDLVSSVNGKVQFRVLGKGGQPYSCLYCEHLGLVRGDNPQDIESFLLHQASKFFYCVCNRWACAQPNNHSRADKPGCSNSSCPFFGRISRSISFRHFMFRLSALKKLTNIFQKQDVLSSLKEKIGGDQGESLLLSLGKSTVSLMLPVPSMVMTKRSQPSPHPACGGIPYSKALR